MVEYTNGHFDWHVDALRPKLDLYDIGTTILLPPLNSVNYYGGEFEYIE
jgi:hypothetical protein